jgi:cytochrome c oxidase subunit 2
MGASAWEAAMNEAFRISLALPPQASSVARGIDTLHYVVIASAFAVAFISFVLIGWFLLRYREDSPRPRPKFRIGARFEATLAGATLAVFLIYWVVGFTQYRALRDPPANAMRVYVVAKQWMWEFVYADGTSAQDDLRVPVGQPVELLMTARDVIHSFYVPSFRLKMDVLPGRTTMMWFTAIAPGEYDILCAEYCGAGHSRMRGRVIAMAPDTFARWEAGHDAPGLAAAGERIAGERGCLRCHTVDGTPHLGPTWLGLYASRVPLTDGTFVTADEAYLTESMMDPNAKLVTGFVPTMPSYFGQLTAPETAAIVEYIRSLRRPP